MMMTSIRCRIIGSPQRCRPVKYYLPTKMPTRIARHVFKLGDSNYCMLTQEPDHKAAKRCFFNWDDMP